MVRFFHWVFCSLAWSGSALAQAPPLPWEAVVRTCQTDMRLDYPDGYIVTKWPEKWEKVTRPGDIGVRSKALQRQLEEIPDYPNVTWVTGIGYIGANISGYQFARILCGTNGTKATLMAFW